MRRGARHGLARQDPHSSESDRPCNALSPSAEEVATRKIIAAFSLPENKDKGVVQLDGRMVERLHADMARRTVAIARAIEERDLEGQSVA